MINFNIKKLNNFINILINDDGLLLEPSLNKYFSKFNNSELLAIPYNSKKVVHTADTNYVVSKFLINIDGKKITQYVLEEWRMIDDCLVPQTNIKIFKNLKSIKNFSNHEQEVIFCLLSGYIQDKEIRNYLDMHNLRNHPCVRYVISVLHEKFETNSRTSLIQSLKAHDLDKYIPKTLFAEGVYDNLDILNINHSKLNSIIAC